MPDRSSSKPSGSSEGLSQPRDGKGLDTLSRGVLDGVLGRKGDGRGDGGTLNNPWASFNHRYLRITAGCLTVSGAPRTLLLMAEPGVGDVGTLRIFSFFL